MDEMTLGSKNDLMTYTMDVYRHLRLQSGKVSVLSIEDWICIHRWQQQGIPIATVLKGIDRAFSINADSISSVKDCESAVEETVRTVSRGPR